MTRRKLRPGVDAKTGQLNLKKKRRSANARCPRCKKVRAIWLRANEWYNGRVASMNVPGEGKVCWICRIREVDPTWTPGMVIPELPNPGQFNPAEKGSSGDGSSG